MDPLFEERIGVITTDCENNLSPIACHQLAEFSSVVFSDFEKSFKLYYDSCYNEKVEHKNPAAQQGLLKSKDGGTFYPPSCFHLGRQYLAGRGCEKSDKDAYRALERSCDDASHVGACYHLGVMLLDGSSTEVKRDEPRGLRCLEKACKEGEVTSCHAIASVLLAGEKNYPAAAKEFKDDKKRADKIIYALTEGCRHGYAPSCFNLAAYYKKAGDMTNFATYKSITEGLVASGNGSGVGR
jgi:TPR repeat protein